MCIRTVLLYLEGYTEGINRNLLVHVTGMYTVDVNFCVLQYSSKVQGGHDYQTVKN